MKIIKRDGTADSYNSRKIAIAIEKSFLGTNCSISKEKLDVLVNEVEQFVLSHGDNCPVEDIQDRVERVLMQYGYYDQAKSYILYRWKRSEQREALNSIVEATECAELEDVLKDVQKEFITHEYSITILNDKFISFCKENMSGKEKLSALIKAAVELTSADAPKWENISGRILNVQLQQELKECALKNGLNSLYDKIKYLTSELLYGEYILANYTKEEIDLAETFIDTSRDNLFNFSGLDLLIKRYIIKTHKHEPVESVQEMFIGIALHLAMNEKNNRMEWVKSFYNLLSKLELTVATPTLANSRKPYHQLSSCFIDTVPDSLDGIYRSLDNFSAVSKLGGGMGLYFGKVRATGSDIRGFKGVAGGLIRWVKLVNDTAVAVDQLGVRQGAVAVYLDVWHKDIPEFLQVRTNNGDDRMKAHDIFPAICYPDLFWKMASENLDQPWYLFCPHDILVTKGYALEDYYGEEWERRYLDCVNDARISKRVINIKDIIRLILRSAVETGTPFMFNRDAVNRANPNKHNGIIYCSNLCTEIAQNMSEIESLSTEIKEVNGETIVVRSTKPGDFVVCNLASLSLGRLPLEDDGEMKKIVATAVRALDNVIDLNFYPLPYAKLTNQKYRSIGLGVSGYHHALAKRGIKWESEEHLDFMDKVFEKINFAAIEASNALAKEKGAYSVFEGSDWQNGEYFKYRGYTDANWQHLAQKVAQYGMRNAYLLAVAPTSSTSIIAGTTAGCDPVMKKFFLEEKKGSMLPRVAPELSNRTFWVYKGAYLIDQTWSIKAAGIRQRHIDQAQSVNLYITNEFSMRQVLNLYLLAWEKGVKTLYYVRSKSLEVEECESCAS